MFPPVFPRLMESDAVKALVGADPARIYEAEAPAQPVAPYVVWAIIGGAPDPTLETTPDTDQSSVQVDCYHATQGGMRQLAYAVRDALEKYATMTGVVAHERTTVDPRLYRIGLQFDFWMPR